ncbi:hypothetical protein D9M68_734460 [compost metagenome]
MQQVLLVALGIGLGEGFGQPVVVADQFGEQRAGVLQQGCFVRFGVDQYRQVADEGTQAVETEGGGHGAGSWWPGMEITVAKGFLFLKCNLNLS